MAALGVSRTVVREAVAALRAEGLVATRQGVGCLSSRGPRPRAVPHRFRRPGSIAECSNQRAAPAIEIQAAGAGGGADQAGDMARIGER